MVKNARPARLLFIVTVAGAACGGPPKPVPVVPASEAPAPPPGTSWNCFEYRSSQATNSSCERTLDECRTSSSEWANTPSYEAGTCQAQPQAFCHHVWWSDGDKSLCFRDKADCERDQNRMKTGYTKQTACTAFD